MTEEEIYLKAVTELQAKIDNAYKEQPGFVGYNEDCRVVKTESNGNKIHHYLFRLAIICKVVIPNSEVLNGTHVYQFEKCY